jgi:hypothetical protein
VTALVMRFPRNRVRVRYAPVGDSAVAGFADNRCLSADLSGKILRENTSHAKSAKKASELSLVIYLPGVPSRSQLGSP